MSNQHARHEGIWTGLLKWSLAQPGFAAEGPDASTVTDEDRAFLKQVFETLVVDEVKRMKIITEILKMPDDEPGIERLVKESAAALEKLNEVTRASRETDQLSPPAATPGKSPSPTALAEAASLGPVPTVNDYKNASIASLQVEMIRRKEGALEELDDRVITAANASDFITVGGLEPLLISMLSPHDGIKWRAAQVLSTMTQNNPKCQKLAFEHQAISYLLPLLTPPPESNSGSSSSSSSSAATSSSSSESSTALRWTVVVKALSALSALVRADDLPQIQTEFMKQGGFEKLILLLTHLPHPTDRVLTKVFSFIRHLLQATPAKKVNMVQVIPILVNQIGRSADINHRESVLKLLIEMAKKSDDRVKETSEMEKARKELQRKEFGLKKVLHDRHESIKQLSKGNVEDQQMFEEEGQLIQQLNKLCKF